MSSPSQEIFQFGETARFTGVPETQLRNWLKGRTVKIAPSIRSASGRGFISLFSRDDLYKIALTKILLGAGQSGERVNETINQAPKHLMRGELLVVEFSLKQSDFKWVKSLDRVSNQAVIAQFVINGKELRKEIDESIERNKKG